MRVASSTSRILAAAFAVLAVLAASLLAPADATAHSHLARSVPADGAVVETAPGRVELTFSDTVTAGPGAIQVFAPDGSEVQRGAARPAQGATITQRIDADRTGTYGVSYRVSSEDGHVINGSTTFSVGTAGGDGAAASRDAATVSRSLQTVFSFARFVEVLALLVVAGGGVFACLIAPNWRPRLLGTATVVLLLSYAVSYVVTGAILESTGVGGALSGDVLRATADTPFGRSVLLRAVIAVVALGPVVLLRSPDRLPRAARGAMTTVFVGLAASLSITGHAVTTEPTWLRMPLDMVHVTAASIWLGGLVQLGFLAPFAASWTDSILRFSRIAFACVVVLLLTGTYAVWAELGTGFRELLDSRYGRLVLAKLALYLGTMPLAWNNMSAFVPAIRRRPEDAPRMLRQYVWRELALLVVIIALTVWLIATPQPA